jgi:DNA-binding MarR family transcriptional regulator
MNRMTGAIGTPETAAPGEPAVSGPRWLDAEEKRTWLALLAAINMLDEELDRQLQRDAGMPLAYYMVLAALSESSGRKMRMSDLASSNNASQSRLTHAVNRLVAAGWVRREKCTSDRRVVYAVLTDEGFEVLKAAAPGHVEAVRATLFDRLTAEQVRRLREIAETLTAGPGHSPRWPGIDYGGTDEGSGADADGDGDCPSGGC